MNETSTRQKLEKFFAKYSAQTYSDGQVIVPPFTDQPVVYFIVSGHVRQYSESVDGQEVIANLYKPTSFFPMITAMTKLPNQFYFEAVEELQVLRAPRAEFINFLQSEPEVMFDLLRRLYIGIDGLLQQMTYNITGDVKQKVIGTLIMAGKRFGELQGSETVITQHFTHKELGLFSGTSRENVTRVMSELQKEELIRVESKRIILVDAKKLEEKLHA